MAEPQLWRTDVMPIRAPRCLGSGRDRDQDDLEQDVVDHGLVVVADTQQFGLALGEPLLRRLTWQLGQWRYRRLL